MAPDRLKALQDRTRYEAAEVESRVFSRWEEAGVFSPPPEGTAAENFSIAVPPPNVTGALHMGHALNASIQDLCIRHARMQGRRAKWIFGTDHAGIGTQVKVEQALKEEGTSREELGREAFVERVWEWRREHGSTILEQFRRIGASLDYADERFTMDDAYVKAVQLVFVRLFEKGLVYRDNYMVNWDPGTRSAISDLEVEQRHVEDTLYMVDYPLESGSGSITVATVRPETMLADTAIAVHPDDERYTRLIGEAAILPLVGRRLPIIADEYVKTDFGTGALKITPGHDPNDFEIGRKHGLEEISVIGEDGLMTAEGYEGLPQRRRAREGRRRTAGRGLDLGHPALLPRRAAFPPLGRADRAAHLAAVVLRHGEAGRRPRSPRQRTARCASTRRSRGPASTSTGSRTSGPGASRASSGGATRSRSGTAATRCTAAWSRPTGDGWERDPDVLDTWFSSALWPFATLGWPDETPQLRAFYPTDVLSTARDIIFLWVARMVMFGVEFTGELPFTDVPIHSVIQAPDGRRMSKSLGTGIDPLDEIDENGADATRFGLLAMSSTQDVRFSAERVRQGRDLANKLWNASRLILLGVQEGSEPSPDRAETVEDRWILSRVERITARTEELIGRFEFSAATLELYEFFWSELCDWYLELAKPRLYDGSEAASATLLFCLDRTLRLLHPVMPHVTEEVWSFLPGERGLLAQAEWPAAGTLATDADAEAELGRAIEAITELRRYREQAGVKPSAILPARLSAEGYEATAEQVARLARLELSENGDARGRRGARARRHGGAAAHRRLRSGRGRAPHRGSA